MPNLVKEGEEEQHNKMEDVDWFIYFKSYLTILHSIQFLHFQLEIV